MVSPAARTVHVILPTESFGGHERMLLTWISFMQAQCTGIRFDIHCKEVHQLLNECNILGIDSVHVVYQQFPSPSSLSGVFDFFRTIFIFFSLPRHSLILLAPGVVQHKAASILWARLFSHHVYCYTPMAYSSRKMNFRRPALKDFIARIFLQMANGWITITDQQKRLIRDQWGIKTPVLVIRNHVKSVDALSAEPHWKPNSPLRVLFLGRFDPNQKGLDWLISELRSSKDKWVGKIQFIFQGNGPFETELQRLACDIGEPSVEIHPWGSPQSALSSCDVLMIPSRFEGFPLVAIEATKLKLPAVASRDCGLNDFLHPGNLFDFGNPQAFWNALFRMQNPVFRAQAVEYSEGRMLMEFSKHEFSHSLEQTAYLILTGRLQGPPLV